MVMVFMIWYSAMPWMEACFPKPECLMPPNADSDALSMAVLMPTMRVSIADDMRAASRRWLVKRYAPRPASEVLAISMALCSVSKRRMLATGPKNSCGQISMSSVRRVRMVGG